MSVKTAQNYVCLSDLHLGAKYSILSSRDERGLYLPQRQSECLQRLAAGLHHYVPQVFADVENKPVLILLGDLLDYSFGSIRDIVQSLEPFIEAFFPEDKSQHCFADDIILVPGNHDHRLWQNLKDQQFLHNYYEERIFESEVRYQSTPLFHGDDIYSEFLQNIPAVKSRGLRFNLRYPNWGLCLTNHSGAINRQVLLHHGHYVESLYRLMTSINQLISDIGDPDIEELERQNGGWVDFLWSSLGASPVQRDNAVLLFDIMQNPAATHQYSRRVAQLIGDYLSLHRGVSPGMKVYSGITLQQLITSLLDASIGRMFQAERADYYHTLSDDGLAGLQWYLGKPLLRQLQSETNAPACADSSFVFGHTHKPFQQAIVVPEFPVASTQTSIIDERITN